MNINFRGENFSIFRDIGPPRLDPARTFHARPFCPRFRAKYTNFGPKISRKIEIFSPKKILAILFLFFSTASTHREVFIKNFKAVRNLKLFSVFWHFFGTFFLERSQLPGGATGQKKNQKSRKSHKSHFSSLNYHMII